MPRYKLTIEYDGAPYFGWQQTAEGPSVQSTLERAILAFSGESASVTAAGRTDAGVHALGQVAHVDLQREYDDFTVMSAINYHLQAACIEGAHTLMPAETRTISVLKAEHVSGDFHARFSASSRHYIYRILNRRSPPAYHAGRVWHVPEALDFDAMKEASALLIGTHDFSSFRDTRCQAKSPVKTLDRLELRRNGEEIEIHLSARSFLHHMVRNITGSLKMVGSHKWNATDFERARDARDRTKGGPTAPAHGLCFMRVDYD